MSVGTLEEIIDDNHAIVSTSVGSEHYVSILSFVDKDMLEPGCTVLLNHKVCVLLFYDCVIYDFDIIFIINIRHVAILKLIVFLKCRNKEQNSCLVVLSSFLCRFLFNKVCF